MSRYGDPDVLDAHARQLAADADGVRARARALEASVARMRWRGEAAEAFRRTVAGDADHLHRAAGELDEAAGAMRAHAEEVRERLAQIRRLERAVADWFDDQLRSLQDAGRGVVPWPGWAWRPRTLPDPGDLAWFDVAADLRAWGVRL